MIAAVAKRLTMNHKGIVFVDNTSAAEASVIVPVITVLAQGSVIIPGIGISPDTIAAFGTDQRGFAQTVGAKKRTVKIGQLFRRELLPTGFAGFIVVHSSSSIH